MVSELALQSKGPWFKPQAQRLISGLDKANCKQFTIFGFERGARWHIGMSSSSGSESPQKLYLIMFWSIHTEHTEQTEHTSIKLQLYISMKVRPYQSSLHDFRPLINSPYFGSLMFGCEILILIFCIYKLANNFSGFAQACCPLNTG